MRGSGFFSRIKKIFFGRKPSAKRKSCCCQDKDDPENDLNGGKYQCQICKRMINEKHSLEHIKAEEYLIELIRKDHSHWRHKKPTCQECIDYYRQLVKNNEI